MVWQGKWFGRENGFAGKKVSQRKWFGRETGFAGKLVSQGNWFRKETVFAGKMVSQRNLFFVILGKTFINIPVVKQSTYNAKVIDNKTL